MQTRRELHVARSTARHHQRRDPASRFVMTEPEEGPPDEPVPLEPLGPVEVPEPDVVDVPEPGIVEVPERV